MVAVQQCCW